MLKDTVACKNSFLQLYIAWTIVFSLEFPTTKHIDDGKRDRLIYFTIKCNCAQMNVWFWFRLSFDLRHINLFIFIAGNTLFKNVWLVIIFLKLY